MLKKQEKVSTRKWGEKGVSKTMGTEVGERVHEWA